MSDERLQVLLIGAECAPFIKIGGLADVIGALPKELIKAGVDARVMMPLHASIKYRHIHELEHLMHFYVEMGWRRQFVGVDTLEKDGVTYYFIDNEFQFGGPVYKGGELEGEQYAFFMRASLETLLRLNFIPDVIHANDWQTGMIPMLLKTQYNHSPLKNTKSLYTIHNLKYQGKFHPLFVKEILGIEDTYFSPGGIEAYGDANFLKAALVYADAINTVSPSYAEEILDPYFGEGLEGILKERRGDLVGILNGIDKQAFNPKKDQYIAQNYSYRDVEKKAVNKEALIKELGLTVPLSTPLIGMVSRLTAQKGLDLIECVIDDLFKRDVAMVVLGNGERHYEQMLEHAVYKYAGKMAINTMNSEEFAHKIYAGADLYLMPSLFEPCGISQLIALRYGTLPIVRKTGGLKDTVIPYNKYTAQGTGFAFETINAHDMLYCIDTALSVYKDDAEQFKKMVVRAMRKDFGFARSAKKYIEIYERLANKG